MPNRKVISIATTIEKNRVASTVAFVVTLDIAVINPATGSTVETLYLVNNTEDLTVNGKVYTATKFDIELKEESGAQTSVTLSMVDFTKAIISKMETYGGGVGFGVIVGVLNTARLSAPPEVQEFFEVTGAQASEYNISFTLGAENPLSKIFPRRLQTKKFCTWRYKDAATCGYTGGLTSCDLTLNGVNGCKAHNNEANFGAFPGINNAGSRYV
jgi:hypothetical protein